MTLDTVSFFRTFRAACRAARLTWRRCARQKRRSAPTATPWRDGEPIPTPRTVEDIDRAGPTDWYELDGRQIALVPYFPAETDRVARVTFSISPQLLDAIDCDAKTRGQTRSAYLAEAARRRMAEP